MPDSYRAKSEVRLARRELACRDRDHATCPSRSTSDQSMTDRRSPIDGVQRALPNIEAERTAWPTRARIPPKYRRAPRRPRSALRRTPYVSQRGITFTMRRGGPAEHSSTDGLRCTLFKLWRNSRNARSYDSSRIDELIHPHPHHGRAHQIKHSQKKHTNVRIAVRCRGF